MKKSFNTPSNSLRNRQSEDTNIYSFLQCVQYLNPLTDNAILKLSERFLITPECLAALIDISLRGGMLLWN